MRRDLSTPATSQPTALKRSVRLALRCGSSILVAGISIGPAHAAEPFPSVFELADIDGINGLVITGINAQDKSGNALANAGDINGDGVTDLLIGGPGHDANGIEDAGQAYVVFGGPEIGDAHPLSLATLNGTNGFAINGIGKDDFAGNAIDGGEDIDGDGFVDIVVGANGANPHGIFPEYGQGYVVFGGPGVGATGTIELVDLDGSDGFFMDGGHAKSSTAGSMSSIGDLNGDGYGDILIGADWADPKGRNDAGQGYVVFGRPRDETPLHILLTRLDGTDGFKVNGAEPWINLGRSAGAAGDVNGDGFADALLGASNAPDGINQMGDVYVIFGGSVPFPPQLEMRDLDGIRGFVIHGHMVTERCGISAQGAGDVNGDAFPDIIVGCMRADPNGIYDAGKSYVVFGGPDVGAGGSFVLSDIDGSNGFVVNGIEESDYSGWQVSGVGDVNADGIDDLIIGAHEADPEGRQGAGQAYVIYGDANLGSEGFIDLSDLDGRTGFTINGIEPHTYAGFAATAAGDVNADGIDDIVVSAFDASPNDVTRAGETYVIFGRAGDSDDDGIANNLDNCTAKQNPDQRDSNHDGYGNACDPDLDNNGIVNFTDLGMLKSVFFTSDQDADLDGNGRVNFIDLGIMKSLFFRPPGPSGLVR